MPTKIDETTLINFMKTTQTPISFRLAGATHDNRQATYKTVRGTHAELVFTHETDNPHDSYAIRVTTKDGKDLGFVPRNARVLVLLTSKAYPMGKYYSYGIRDLNKLLYNQNLFGRVREVFDEKGTLFVSVVVVLDL